MFPAGTLSVHYAHQYLLLVSPSPTWRTNEKMVVSGTDSHISLAHKCRPNESCHEAFSGNFAGLQILPSNSDALPDDIHFSLIFSRAAALVLTLFHASQVVLKYTGIADVGPSNPPTGQEQIDLLRKLYKHTLKRTELRDELFAQLAKQTRNNSDRWVWLMIERVLGTIEVHIP